MAASALHSLDVAMRGLDVAMGAFCRVLRGHGFAITAAEAMDALRALEVVDLEDREEVRLALRAVLTSRMEELAVFDRCFDAFWRVPATLAPPPVNEFPVPPPPLPWPGETPPGTERPGGAPEGRTLREWAAVETEKDGGDPLAAPAMSDLEVLAEKDFSTFTSDELDELLRLTRKIARRLACRISRRRRPTHRRQAVDLRRSVRRNVTRGELIELAYRERKPKKVRLVVLCDVSGSMDLYSRFLLQFLYALQAVFGRVETFTFSTRLTRVTEHLKGRSFTRALAQLGAVHDWSGGTRIGASLAQFNQDWGARLVDRRTLVMILSDGWDTGEPELLARELLAIRRRARRLVWLNPLLGSPSYEPLTRGMAAALPLVHAFVPAHNLASLRALNRHLRV